MTEFPRLGDQLAHDTVQGLADAGLNTLKIAAEGCHEAGIGCYASLRYALVNDFVHEVRKILDEADTWASL